ncbi:glycoside hydrolase family 16 protein [Mycena albidolilacea]|uniref:Glycoside hydrolase family 16 protein n=1 Tax=Mycena albidolilacea TaxID=1033008 RepID=A0AAD7AH90_9AGAR|nr:glycoside hydrolase family 16 protein [Mycena albidolilacea]
MPSIAGPFLALSFFLATVSAAIPSLSGYNVVWSDDFNGAQGVGVDSSKWVQKVGPTGANGELEVYTSGTGNVHLSGDGQLYIIPTLSGGTWHSGRLESNAAWFAPTGGAMILQSELWVPDFAGSPAKFGGLWPAFWTKGNNYRSSGVPWPRCGEWDIFEVTDKLGNQNQGTLHFEDASGANNGAFNKRVTYATGQYHTWAFKVDLRNSDWTKQALTWYLDGVEFYKVTGAMIGTFEQWVQLAWNDYYIILNVAVGGDYPGYPTSQTVSGYDSSMRVRYVAVYKTV